MDENLPQIALVLKARAGNSRAKENLVKIWYHRVYNFALKFLGDHDQAMEVAQKTFITLCLKIHRLKDPSKFRSWLYTVVNNHCKEERRKWSLPLGNGLVHDPKARETAHGNTFHEPYWKDPNPEESLIRQEEAEEMAQILLRIPEEQRVVLIMKEYEDLKFREIAEALGISENTAKSRLYYAFKQLRKILEKKAMNENSIDHGKYTK